VCEALIAADPELPEPGALETVIIKTTGDHILDRPLAAVGGKGLFTKEIEEALLEERIDVAVHSMKDMPTELPAGLAIGALLPRADPRDVLIATVADTIEALPEGALVGTASLRRAAQLKRLRPDLHLTTLRGSVATRLRKVAEGEVAATFLAAAGLERLGMAEEARHRLAPEVMLPAVAQGAVGVECRKGDRAMDLLAKIDHALTRAAVEAERRFLARLDGSCRTPIAGYCRFENGAALFDGLVARPDGSEVLSTARRGPLGDAGAMALDAGAELAGRAGPGFFAVEE